MYQIAVCDDQQKAIDEIIKNLRQYKEKYDVDILETPYSTPDKLIGDIENGMHYDIIFLDIEMPMISGIKVMRELESMNVDSVIIVVSAYLQYSIEAIELNVFRYLMKYCEKDMFERYLNAALKEVDSKKRDNYVIATARKKILVNCSDIFYCYKSSKMVVMVTVNGEIRERKSLQKMLEDLQKLCDYFIMAERGYIVNLHYIEKIIGNEIYLKKCPEKIPIGSTYEKQVKTALNTFWRKRLCVGNGE